MDFHEGMAMLFCVNLILPFTPDDWRYWNLGNLTELLLSVVNLPFFKVKRPNPFKIKIIADLVRDAIECPFGQVLMGRSCEVLQIATPAPPPAGACTDGWIEGAATQGKCYRFVTDSLSASDAKKMCRAANGDLLVIKSEAEQVHSFIFFFISILGCCWIR